MEDLFYFNELYDLYGKLLTEKQQEYFEEYYFNNLSFSEIAENYDVSRNAVFKQLNITKAKLIEYEEKLELMKKRKIIEEIIQIEAKEEIKNKLESIF